MKLCVLGGGGVRSPFLAKSIAYNAEIAHITEVVYMDNDPAKLGKYGELAKQISIRINPKLTVHLETDARKALHHADYVITTLRVGGDESRVNDEKIVSKYGLLAQETTGACGFAMAMRSIPKLLEYCQIVREVAQPNCLIFNFTNPSGIVTQAMNDAGYPVIGICDAPSEFVKQLVEMIGASEKTFTCNCFGLNHYSWFNQFFLNGKDVSDTILKSKELFTKTEMRLFDQDILHLSEGMLPNEYFYFYYYNYKVIELNKQSQLTRAQLIAQVNQKMNEALKDVDVAVDFEKAFKIFFDHYNIRENNYMKTESGKTRVINYVTQTPETFIKTPDAGGYAGVALRCVKALETNEPVDMILSIPNQGAISFLLPNDIVEISCTVDGNGIHPKTQEKIPQFIQNSINTMKEYERTAVRSILTQDRNLAIKALLFNPLIANHNLAKAIIDEFIDQYAEDKTKWK